MIPQTYSDEIKRDAVARVQAGQRVMDVANQLGIPRGTLWGWVRRVEKLEHQRQPIQPPVDDVDTMSHQAALDLVHELRTEVEDLQQAIVYLAKKLGS